jgi:coproporphyrinogen III oxidase
MSDHGAVTRLQSEAPVWFADLRDRICAALEALEAKAEGRSSPKRPRRAASSAGRGSAPTTTGAAGAAA